MINTYREEKKLRLGKGEIGLRYSPSKGLSQPPRELQNQNDPLGVVPSQARLYTATLISKWVPAAPGRKHDLGGAVFFTQG